MNRWYVASTHPKAESFARDNLNDQGFEVFLPLKTDRVIRRQKIVHTSAPLFPSYIFVNFDRDTQRWRSINGTRGVQRLVCSGLAENPLPLAAGVVEEIQSREANGEFGPKEEETGPLVTAGQAVRIVSGPLCGFEGICTLSRSERVRVLFSKFSKTVEFRAAHVIAA